MNRSGNWTATLTGLADHIDRTPLPDQALLAGGVELAAQAAADLLIPRGGPVPLAVCLAGLRIGAARTHLEPPAALGQPAARLITLAALDADIPDTTAHHALATLLAAVRHGITRHLAGPDGDPGQALALARAAVALGEAETELAYPVAP